MTVNLTLSVLVKALNAAVGHSLRNQPNKQLSTVNIFVICLFIYGSLKIGQMKAASCAHWKWTKYHNEHA